MLKIWSTGSLCFLIISLKLWSVDDVGVKGAEIFRRVPRSHQGRPTYSTDIVLNPSSIEKSRLRSGLWTKEGIIFLYSKRYHSNKIARCALGLAIDLIRFYSCIPVYSFEISVRCASINDSLGCARRPAEKDDNVDSYTAMVKAGVLEKMQAAEDYVMILDEGDICQSHLGRIGKKQELWLGISCLQSGTIIHELIHALGYTHEHSRQDRDDYVNIYKEYIEPEAEHNFVKTDNATFQDYGPYDLYSIMHYKRQTFSKDRYNRSISTILPKNMTLSVIRMMGQKTHLRMGDKIKIRSVTQCPGETYEDHVKSVLELQSKQHLYTGEHTEMHIIIVPCKNLDDERSIKKI